MVELIREAFIQKWRRSMNFTDISYRKPNITQVVIY
jgi:hypothetical protein